MPRSGLRNEKAVRVKCSLRPGKLAEFRGEKVGISMDIDAEMPPEEANVIYRLIAFGGAETFRKVLALLDEVAGA